MPTSTQLVTGLTGAIGCDFRQAQNRLYFVEYGGKLSSLDLFPTPTVVAQSTSTVLKGTFLFDFDTGTEGGLSPNADVFWEQITAVKRQMAPQNSAQIVNLGTVDFNSLTATGLQALPYSSTPIDGNNDSSNKLVVNDVFAVHTTSGNYAKVKVLSYGYNLTIEWVTYHIPSGYKVLGTGYNQPEDVKISADGLHAYVTERTGDLVKVALSSPNRASATVIASGMAAPQQFFLDEAHNAAYVVQYEASGSLLKIDLNTSAQTTIASGLNYPVGLTLSSDLQYAYVSEQTTGPDLGRVSSIQISSGTRATIAKGLTAPFFLAWADAAQDTLLVPQRDPSNSILSVNLALGSTTVVASGVPFRPSSVALPNPTQILICSDSVIEEVALITFPVNGPLLMGIGFIPFDQIIQTAGPLLGLADTTVDPSYFYQVKDTPFGGTLPIMVNYQSALSINAAYYQVKIDGVPHTDAWSDYLWNGVSYVLQTISPQTVGTAAGCYPTRPLGQLFLWLNPSLGDLLNTTGLTNGLHALSLEFLDGAGNPITSTTPITICVNNQACIATLTAPLVGGSPADACGVLHYGTNKTAVVSIGFTASQPANFATFSFSMVRGVTPVALPASPPTSGPVSTAVSPITDTVGTLLGACPTAGFAVELYVAATINNGWSRQSQYDAEALLGFVLTP